MGGARMDYLGCWDPLPVRHRQPIVNLSEYWDYVTRIVPEERRPVFDNANRVYGLGLTENPEKKVTPCGGENVVPDGTIGRLMLAGDAQRPPTINMLYNIVDRIYIGHIPRWDLH